MKSKISKLQSELDKLYAAQRDYSTHYAYSKYNMRVEAIKNKGYKVYRNNAGNHIVEKDYKRNNSTYNYSSDKNLGYKKRQLSSSVTSFLELIFNKKVIGLIVVVAIIIFAGKMGFIKFDKGILKKSDIRGKWDITWYGDGNGSETWKEVIIQDNAIIHSGGKIDVEKITEDEVIFPSHITDEMGNWKYSIDDGVLNITSDITRYKNYSTERITATVHGIGYRLDN